LGLQGAIFTRASEVVPIAPTDPYTALRDDPGLRSILEASPYSKGVAYATIVDTDDVAIAHSDAAKIHTKIRKVSDLSALLQNSGIEIYRRLLASEGENFEVEQQLLLNGAHFGYIRIGVSTLLVVPEVNDAIRPNRTAALIALAVATFLALGLAQLFLRPIHVIRGALTRLGKGELGVTVDMPQRDEFGELGSFFNALSAQLSADRSTLAGEKAKLESIVDNLEDAVAIFNPEGEFLFANPAMRAALPRDAFARPIDDVLPAGHPYRQAVEETLASRQAYGPVSAIVEQAATDDSPTTGERLVMTHVISDVGDRIVGVMLVARNLDYLSRVQSTINYSRKLLALGRLSAGVAHEVKNPLNAMTIHLELLRQKLAAARATLNERGEIVPLSGGGPLRPADIADGVIAPRSMDVESTLEHVKVITNEIKRLDEVVQGFLKFTRPEEVKLQAIAVRGLVEDVARIVAPEAATAGVQVHIDCPDSVPDISGDSGMLRQALLNLAINACQAMPGGGHLRITCSAARGRRVEIKVEDTGVGISSENLERIFNLYFTTKEKGSGIGLSMVYRIVQLHDGEIEVESMPGVGTTFRLLLPQL
jgi:signal transduction histidine kinase